jgi:hypothetical protein
VGVAATWILSKRADDGVHREPLQVVVVCGVTGSVSHVYPFLDTPYYETRAFRGMLKWLHVSLRYLIRDSDAIVTSNMASQDKGETVSRSANIECGIPKPSAGQLRQAINHRQSLLEPHCAFCPRLGVHSRLGVLRLLSLAAPLDTTHPSSEQVPPTTLGGTARRGLHWLTYGAPRKAWR